MSQSFAAVGYHFCLAFLRVRLVGDNKTCILPLIKISHMLQLDGSIKSPEPPRSGDGAGCSANDMECCVVLALNDFLKEGVKDSVEEIYWLPCKSQCKPITSPCSQPFERHCDQSVWPPVCKPCARLPTFYVRFPAHSRLKWDFVVSSRGFCPNSLELHVI